MAVLEVSDATYEAEVINSEKPVLVDFWAAWCGPCQMMSPVVEAVAAAKPELKVCKVNTDENINLAMALQIDAIPALLAYEGGQEVARLAGYRPQEQLLDWLQEIGLLA